MTFSNHDRPKYVDPNAYDSNSEGIDDRVSEEDV